MLSKTLELCKENKIEYDIPVGNLAKSLTDLTNTNWNIFYDEEFESIVFELKKRDRVLSFVFEPKLNKTIWFQQEHAKVISGFDPNSDKLDNLIKWLEN